jgi:hypothetical protein
MKEVEIVPQPHMCPAGHLQDAGRTFVYRGPNGLTADSGPVCLSCVFLYLGRTFPTMPVPVPPAEDKEP